MGKRAKRYLQSQDPAVRRSILRLLFALAAVATAHPGAAAETTAKSPNILFVFLDDFGWRDTGFMGSDFYETPNLDQLAQDGMVFTNAYACAANCAPSRACLLSGQYTPRHEVYNVGTSRRGKKKFGSLMHVPGTDTLDRDIRTWAECIREAGYRTASMGKWHLSDDPLPYGFDVNVGGSHSGSPPRGYYPPHPNAPGLQDAADDEYLTDTLHDEAIGFIERNQDRPWLLYLTHFAVHTPLQGKPELVEKYQQKPEGDLHDSAVMAAMIESVDRGIGRLMNKLQSLGIDNNTVIILGSDNGGYGPATSMAPLKGYKGTYYEGGIRVPLVVRWPGVVQAGQVCDVPVTGVDVYPTLCEIAAAPLPAGQVFDGKSLVPLLKRERFPEDRPLFWHFPAYLQSYSRTDQQRDPLYRSRPCSIIREGDWKLHEYFEDGAIELYNLETDIGETTNLVRTNPAKAEELRGKLRQWRAEIDAPVPTTPNPDYDAEAERAAIERATKRMQNQRKRGTAK